MTGLEDVDGRDVGVGRGKRSVRRRAVFVGRAGREGVFEHFQQVVVRRGRKARQVCSSQLGRLEMR